MNTAPLSPSPLLFAAPPGARSAVATAAPPSVPVDRAEVSELPPERLGVNVLAAAASALALFSALAPSTATAAPVAGVSQPLDADGSVGSRRDDLGETHPAWGLVDKAEDALRKLGGQARKAGEAVREAVPEPARQGVRDAKEAARQIDSLGAQGKIGEYGYSFDVIDADLDLNPRASLSDGFQVGVKLETEANLFRSRLSKVEETPGGWRVEKGLRGGLFLRNDLTALAGGDSSLESTTRAELRGEAFQEWRGTWRGYQVRFEVAPGMAQDLLNGNTVAYARFEQNLDGGSFQFMDRNLSWTGEARQEYRYNLSGDSGYEYRVFGGVSHKFDTRLLGRKVDVEMKVGPEFRGTDASGMDVQPRVKFKVRY